MLLSASVDAPPPPPPPPDALDDVPDADEGPPPKDRRLDAEEEGSELPEKKTRPDGMGALPLPRPPPRPSPRPPRPPCPDRDLEDSACAAAAAVVSPDDAAKATVDPPAALWEFPLDAAASELVPPAVDGPAEVFFTGLRGLNLPCCEGGGTMMFVVLCCDCDCADFSETNTSRARQQGTVCVGFALD